MLTILIAIHRHLLPNNKTLVPDSGTGPLFNVGVRDQNS